MEKDIIELNSELIENMIYVVRGKRVMLDFELAQIYGYDTRDFNNQVKHNIERFDKDFRFQLNEKEWNEILAWKKSTANNLLKRRTLPFAFTEQGIYMLMTVLKGDLAIKQSKALIRAFKQMKDYIFENKEVLSLNEGIKLTNLVNEHSNRLDIIESKLDVVMDNFIDPAKYKHFLIKDGQKIEADVAYQEIYKMAKKVIIIIDDYIDVKTLHLLRIVNKDIKITIFSDNKSKNSLTNHTNICKH